MATNPAGMVRGLYAAITLVDKATAPLNQVNQAMDKTKPRVQALQQDVEKVQQQADKAGGVLGGVTDKLKQNQAAIAALGAAMTAAGAAGTWLLTSQAKRASEYEAMAVNFRRQLGDNTDTMLDEMDRAAAGTVSAYEQIKQANYAMTMGIDPEVIPSMMEAARAAAKRFGGDVSGYYSSIVMGTARQSRMILDNLGIIVDAEAAYKEYAKSIGKSASALDEAERKEAYQAEVMRQAKKMVEETDMTVGAYGDQVAQLTVLQEEFNQELAGTTIPAQMAVLGVLKDVLGILKETPGPIKAVVGLLALVTTGAMAVVGPLITSAAAAAYLGTTLGVSSAGILTFAGSIGAATLAAAPWLIAILAIIGALLVLQDIWVKGWEGSHLGALITGMQERMKALQPIVDKTAGAFEWFRGLLDQVRAGIQNATAAIDKALENPAIQAALSVARLTFGATPLGIAYNAATTAQSLLPMDAVQAAATGSGGNKIERMEVNVNIPEVATRMDQEEFKQVVKAAGGEAADEANRRLTSDLRALGAGVII